MAKSTPEGTVFLVRELAGGSAMGVVARRQPRGHVVAVYLFHPVSEPKDGGTPRALPRPEDAAFRGKFSDWALREGKWESLGVHPDFRREDWPFDRAVHREVLTGRCELLFLDDRNPLIVTESDPVDCDACAGLPTDILYDPLSLKRILG